MTKINSNTPALQGMVASPSKGDASSWKTITNFLQGLVGGVGGVAGDVGKVALGRAGLDLQGVDTEYADLLTQQMEVQKQMMLVSTISNVQKTEHDTDMAIVRNLRVA